MKFTLIQRGVHTKNSFIKKTYFLVKSSIFWLEKILAVLFQNFRLIIDWQIKEIWQKSANNCMCKSKPNRKKNKKYIYCLQIHSLMNKILNNKVVWKRNFIVIFEYLSRAGNFWMVDIWINSWSILFLISRLNNAFNFSLNPLFFGYIIEKHKPVVQN